MSYLSFPFITLSSFTGGASIGESVELEPALVLPNGEGYTIRIQAIARGSVGGVQVTQGWVQNFCVRRDNNISVIKASDTQDQFGDTAASSWTLTVSIGLSPDRFKIIFTTGSTQSAVNIYCDVFITQNTTPAGYTQTPFKYVNGLYYDPANDLVYVADLEQTTAIIPVLNGASGTTNTVISVPSSAGWGSGSNNGAARFYADSNYVYAMPSGNGSAYVVLINKSTRAVVGYMNPLWAGTQYFSRSLVTDGTYVYMSVSDQYITNGANILQFRIADAISSFPTAATPIAANTDSVNLGFGNQPWLTHIIAFDGTYLWLASNYNATSGYAGDYELVFKVDTSLVTQSFTKYNSANTYPSTQDLEYIFGDIIWSVGGNAFSPYQTFSGSTAQIWSNGSPFITLPTSPSPFAAGAQSGAVFAEPIDNTMLVTLSSGSYQAVARYNSSGSLVSIIPMTPSVAGNYGCACSVTSSNLLWFGGYNNTSGFVSTIDVYSHTLGSETLQYQITGF